MLVKDWHDSKADSPIIVMVSGMVTLERDLHLQNVNHCISVTEEGIFILARDVQP